MNKYRIINAESLWRRANTDVFFIACVPTDEPCTQVQANGLTNYPAMKLECQTFADLIERTHGTPPDGAEIAVIRNYHELGNYYDVGVIVNTEKEEAILYAFNVEENTPSKWDDKAIEMLIHNEHPAYFTPFKIGKAI